MKVQFSALYRGASDALHQAYNSLPTAQETVDKIKEVAPQVIFGTVFYRLLKVPTWKQAFFEISATMFIFNANAAVNRYISSSNIPTRVKGSLHFIQNIFSTAIGIAVISSKKPIEALKIAFSITFSSLVIGQVFQRTILKKSTEKLEISPGLETIITQLNEEQFGQFPEQMKKLMEITPNDTQILQQAINRRGSLSYEDTVNLFLQYSSTVFLQPTLTGFFTFCISKYAFKIATIPLLNFKILAIFTSLTLLNFVGRYMLLEEILTKYRELNPS